MNKYIILLFGLLFLLMMGFTSAADCFATGGTITYDGDYCIHTFKSNGSLVVTGTITDAQVMVIAGGGAGGGTNNGGGGGAGGLIYNNSYTLTGTLTATIGNGGVGTTGTIGASGQNSSFGAISATGGGGGGGGDAGQVGQIGGSGGGSAYSQATTFGARVTNILQGNNGSAGQGVVVPYRGGGGGGSGIKGYIGYAGNGTNYTINGSNTYWAGGGAGGENSIVLIGGLGGGGNGGGNSPSNIAPTAGAPNTGGGGGGCQSSSTTGGSGGSGIIIVRYMGAPTIYSNISGKVLTFDNQNIFNATVVVLGSNNQKLGTTTSNTTGDWLYTVVNGTSNMTVVGYNINNVSQGGNAYPYIQYNNNSLNIILKSSYTPPIYTNVTIELGVISIVVTMCNPTADTDWIIEDIQTCDAVNVNIGTGIIRFAIDGYLYLINGANVTGHGLQGNSGERVIIERLSKLVISK